MNKLWVTTFVVFQIFSAESVRECRTKYVHCRANAQCDSDFYVGLHACKKEYTACKKQVRDARHCGCRNSEWRNSFYFLG